MAGFGSLGSNGFGNIGGSFGQNAPAGYGIQPPSVSPYGSTGYLGVSAGSPPRQTAGYYQDQQSYGIGPDTSQQHQENVALGQLFGPNQDQQMNLNWGTPGTSYSSYGMNPAIYKIINQFMMNPQGNIPQGDYGGGSSTAGMYNNIVNSIRNAMSQNQNFSGLLPSQTSQMGLDMPLRFGSAFGTLPPSAIQNLGISNPNLPGIRGY